MRTEHLTEHRAAPRFDRPVLTSPATEVMAALQLDIAPQAPIPPLVEPPVLPSVANPSSEPLVPVQHRRIRTLSNYWHAGWHHAMPVTLLRVGTFDRLAAVAESLPDRFGLAVFDGWRPLNLQAELYDAAYANDDLPAGFVSEPIADPTMPPPHLTGGTVDITLTVDGIALAPASGFDDFTDGAHADVLEADDAEAKQIDRDVRRMLYWHMHAAGFVVLQQEWWHFEFGTRRRTCLEREALGGRSSPTGHASRTR
jgi:zinc D-Ala-D-Ala dipeptidase